MHVIICIAILLLLVPQTSIASEWQHSIHDATALIKDKVIEWRHHFHANPELGNREFKTAEKLPNTSELSVSIASTQGLHTPGLLAF